MAKPEKRLSLKERMAERKRLRVENEIAAGVGSGSRCRLSQMTASDRELPLPEITATSQEICRIWIDKDGEMQISVAPLRLKGPSDWGRVLAFAVQTISSFVAKGGPEKEQHAHDIMRTLIYKILGPSVVLAVDEDDDEEDEDDAEPELLN